MNRITLATVIMSLVVPGAVMLSGCQGIFAGVYDEPEAIGVEAGIGQIIVDASDWLEWHYIDVSNGKVVTVPIPTESVEDDSDGSGIYTYWFDVFGEGVTNYEFRDFYAVAQQPEPQRWSFAVHRNNVRTNGGAVCETKYKSFADLPSDPLWPESLDFVEDEWNQTDVWAVQDRMLSGIIGSQGIMINNVLSRWLTIEIPPMPPTFARNNHIFILRLSDGSYAALQLADYMSASGTKCHMTINYKYPL